MNNFEIKIQGDSMFPLILSDDILIVEQTSSYNIGDIIIFRDEMKVYIAHRIISLSPLRTKGDFSVLSEIVTHETIFGRVSAIKKNKSEVSLYGKGLPMRLFAEISKMRLKGPFLRKISLLLLHVITTIFLLIYSRPRRDHI